MYDISKSKRTRRATLYSLTKVEDQHGRNDAANPSKVSDEKNHEHVKLKQLMSVDIKENNTICDHEKDKGSSNNNRAILGQYFADEKHLQLVIKQPEDGVQGVKLKGIVKRYVKVLSKMVKSKRNQRLDKPPLRLSM